MIKILAFTSIYPPPFYGGQELSIHTLYSNLPEEIFEISIQTFDIKQSEFSKVSAKKNIIVYRYPFKYYGHPIIEKHKYTKFSKYIFHLINNSIGFGAKNSLKNILKIKPDIIITHNLSGWGFSPIFLARLMKIELISDVHDLYLICTKTTRWLEKKDLCKKTCVTCIPRLLASKSILKNSTVVANSEYTKDEIKKYMGEKNRFVVINPPVDVRNFDRMHILEPKFEVGFLGRITKSKGIEEFLKVVDELQMSCAVAGEGEMKDQLSMRYPKIEFLGIVNQFEFLKQIGCLVVPSLSPETFGRVVPEAMTMGIPIVASSRGALPKHIIRSGGILETYDPSEPNSMNRAILKALKHGRNKENVTREYLDYIFSKQVNKYIDLFESLRR